MQFNSTSANRLSIELGAEGRQNTAARVDLDDRTASLKNTVDSLQSTLSRLHQFAEFEYNRIYSNHSINAASRAA